MNIHTITYDDFGYCSSLTSVILLNSVVTISFDAFVKCTKLANISIPYGVTSIGSSSFKYCIMESIFLPESITSIGS